MIPTSHWSAILRLTMQNACSVTLEKERPLQQRALRDVPWARKNALRATWPSMKSPRSMRCLPITTFASSGQDLDSGRRRARSEWPRPCYFLVQQTKKRPPPSVSEVGNLLFMLRHRWFLDDELSAHLPFSRRVGCTVDLPELGAVIQVTIGLPWYAMVEEVEGFSPEFESSSLSPDGA